MPGSQKDALSVVAFVGFAAPPGCRPRRLSDDDRPASPLPPRRPPLHQRQQDGGVLARVGEGLLKLEVCAPDVIRVAYAKDQAFFARKSLAAEPKRCDGATWNLAETSGRRRCRPQAPRPRRPGHGPRVVPRPDRRSHPRREGPAAARSCPRSSPARTRRTCDRSGCRSRRVAVRARRKPPRPAEHQGPRPRSLAAQRHHRHPVPGLQPRLGHPVGQHLVHALRRPARAGADPGRTSVRRPRQARRLHRARTTRALTSRSWSASASIVSSTSRCPARRRGPTASSSPACPRARTPACAGRASSSPKSRATTRSRRSRTAASRCGSTTSWSSTTGARAGCRGRTWPGCGWRRSAAPRSRSSGARTRTWRRCSCCGSRRPPTLVGDDVAVVGGRRRHRLHLRLRPGAGSGRRRLPSRHRAGADDPALGAGAVAKPAALRDSEGEPRRRRRLPQARHPLRQHRAGLVLLEGRQLGLARVRPGALPRSGQVDPRHPRQARPRDDLRVGQVLPGHEELRGDAHAGLPVPAQPVRRVARLGRQGRRLPVHVLRRVQSGGGGAVLGADEPRAVSPQGGRVVAGRARAGPAADAHARRAAQLHAPDRARLRPAHAQRLLAAQQHLKMSY